jgi:hypothetical protein
MPRKQYELMRATLNLILPLQNQTDNISNYIRKKNYAPYVALCS